MMKVLDHPTPRTPSAASANITTLATRRALIALTDVGAWSLALAMGSWLRLDFHLAHSDISGLLMALPLAALCQIVAGLAFGLYLGRWWFGSFEEVAALVRAVSLTTVLLGAVDLLIEPRMIPLSVAIGSGPTALVLMGATRYTWRLLLERRRVPSASASRVLVFGAGEGGIRIIAAMLRDPSSAFRPVGLLDDDSAKRNLRIMGVPVLGDRLQMKDAAERVGATALVLAVPSAEVTLFDELSQLGVEAGLEVMALPPLSQLFGLDINVEDIVSVDSPHGDGAVAFATPDVEEADIRAVVNVIRSGWLTTGGVCAGLERDLGEYLGVSNVVTVSSCTAALEIAFARMNLQPGSRVGVPTWTFVASALAPSRYGATPVLLDVDPGTLNLSAEALRAALAEGLDAVVAVHFAGTPVPEEIHRLCREASVPIVEDAAHALGATDHRGRLGGQGSFAACYSFYATKNLTAGEGGALVTEDDDLAEFARAYRIHGMSADAIARYGPGGSSSYDLVAAGIKGNLPDVLASLARSQLRRYDAMQARRRELVLHYRERLTEESGVKVIPAEFHPGSADHLMSVLLPAEVSRQEVTQQLTAQGVSTSVHFRPLHTFGWFERHAVIGPMGTPCADALAGRALSLPLHSGLRHDQVDFVCDALLKSVRV
jgi:dTDP-4-amino-4,6-dideoxygalactose transaminase